MKKLMIMVIALSVAGFSQAATCNWGSGALKTASSANGGWSSTYAHTANATVTMNIYFLADKDAYDALATKSMKELYDSYNGTKANLTGQNKNATTEKLIGAITINDTTTAIEGTQYAVAIATYNDATYGDMYIATRVATLYTSSTKVGSASNIISGVGSWSPVPEPTSGLLMLLGFAGLALRRKRA